MLGETPMVDQRAPLPSALSIITRLVDFKVRILDSSGGTAATTRVMIESADGKGRWSTIGVSPNIVDASYNALYDAITYKLFRDGAAPAGQGGGTVGSTGAPA